MKRYFRLYLKFLEQYIKTLIEYRADFILGLIGFLFVQSIGVIFITLIQLPKIFEFPKKIKYSFHLFFLNKS